jgi:hypothetical protein
MADARNDFFTSTASKTRKLGTRWDGPLGGKLRRLGEAIAAARESEAREEMRRPRTDPPLAASVRGNCVPRSSQSGWKRADTRTGQAPCEGTRSSPMPRECEVISRSTPRSPAMTAPASLARSR